MRTAASHLCGATLLFTHRTASPVTFYQSLFPTPNTDATKLASRLKGFPDFTRRVIAVGPDDNVVDRICAAHGGALWVPNVAAPLATMHQWSMSHTVKVIKQFSADGADVLITSREPVAIPETFGEEAPAAPLRPELASPVFRVCSCESIEAAQISIGEGAIADMVVPPPLQPRLPGVVNWLDVCAPKGNEKRLCRFLRSTFDMNIGAPIKIPNNLGLYVTMFNTTGHTSNRDKVLGVVPMHLLLPDMASEGPRVTTLPFFACSSKEDLETRHRHALSLGAKTVLGPISADGDVVILRDGIVGAHFALYFRTDDWYAEKPYSRIDNDIERAEPVSAAA